MEGILRARNARLGAALLRGRRDSIWSLPEPKAAVFVSARFSNAVSKAHENDDGSPCGELEEAQADEACA